MPLTLYGGGQSVIQVASATYDSQASSSASGAPNSQSNGIALFNINFTPLSATSNILVQTSTIEIHEQSNVLDVPWVALWVGSTFYFANSGSARYDCFASSYNMAHHNLNHVISSWGTSTQTVQIRAGMGTGGGGQTFYVNGNTAYYYSGSQARISCTIMEIATS
jgi:hypothetical protein